MLTVFDRQQQSVQGAVEEAGLWLEVPAGLVRVCRAEDLHAEPGLCVGLVVEEVPARNLRGREDILFSRSQSDLLLQLCVLVAFICRYDAHLLGGHRGDRRAGDVVQTLLVQAHQLNVVNCSQRLTAPERQTPQSGHCQRQLRHEGETRKAGEVPALAHWRGGGVAASCIVVEGNRSVEVEEWSGRQHKGGDGMGGHRASPWQHLDVVELALVVPAAQRHLPYWEAGIDDAGQSHTIHKSGDAGLEHLQSESQPSFARELLFGLRAQRPRSHKLRSHVEAPQQTRALRHLQAVALWLPAGVKEGVAQNPSAKAHVGLGRSCQQADTLCMAEGRQGSEAIGATSALEACRDLRFQVRPVRASEERQRLRGASAPADGHLKHLLLQHPVAPQICLEAIVLHHLEGAALVREEGGGPAQRLGLEDLFEGKRKGSRRRNLWRLRPVHFACTSSPLLCSSLQRCDGDEGIHAHRNPESTLLIYLNVVQPLKPMGGIRGPHLQLLAARCGGEVAAQLKLQHLLPFRLHRVEAPVPVHAATLERLQDDGKVLEVATGDRHKRAALRQQPSSFARGEVGPTELRELGGVGGGPHWSHDLIVTTPGLEGVEEAIPKALQVRVHTPNQRPGNGRRRVHPNVVLVDHPAPAASSAPVCHRGQLLRGPEASARVRPESVQELLVGGAGVVQTNSCHQLLKALITAEESHELLRGRLARCRVQKHQLSLQLGRLNGGRQVEDVPGIPPGALIPNPHVVDVYLEALLDALQPGHVVENVVLAKEGAVADPARNTPGQRIGPDLRIPGLGFLQQPGLIASGAVRLLAFEAHVRRLGTISRLGISSDLHLQHLQGSAVLGLEEQVQDLAPLGLRVILQQSRRCPGTESTDALERVSVSFPPL
mmetsp:Transcript_37747/g.90252  ORF Transcript_37747/g.90252 Transcript_37747/m.90252 type:complete len:886 (-) Transcript_37747:224-2881(-)